MLVALVLAQGAGTESSELLDRRTRTLMHTEVTLALPSSLDAGTREAAFTEGFAVFEVIERDLNEWRPESALAKVNAADAGTAVDAPKALCDVVTLALAGARRTNGLFDPSWAALRDVWKFGSAEDGAVPSKDDVAKACAKVGWQRVTVTPKTLGACTITLQAPGMKLGLGGVVKGWGVDQVVSRFRARGLRDFFVQAGGDLYVGGLVGGRPWRVGIRAPRGDRASTFARLELSDSAFSTSGDYEHFFVRDGVRYHHLIDPRTCWPARASVSTTVLAKTATDAEFLTKAAFILGPKEGQPLARTFGAAAVWVTPDGQVHATKGLETKLEVWPLLGFDGGVP